MLSVVPAVVALSNAFEWTDADDASVANVAGAFATSEQHVLIATL